jgi:hypothetical protein
LLTTVTEIVRFPEEKIRYEVATMRYVAAHTTIPVPKIYHYGPASENPTGLGPFMIVEYIDHERTLSHALTDPTRDDQHHMLDPNITEERLDFLYRQMASIIVQLSTLTFPRIGSLLEDKVGNISVTNRPLIMNMNKLADHARVPPWILPCGAFSTNDEWYSALADIHMAQLVFQHNDAIRDEEDARDKYVARQLFRRLAAEGRLSHGMGHHKYKPDGTFRLWCEDLRPSNVLVDKDDRVVGVIDWEFTYAAPSQFTFDPPWWLLLTEPEWWEDGAYPEWMEAYEPRLQTFLRILDEEESKLPERERQGRSYVPLAQRMRESWETKSWMVNFAARKTWCFDALFWRYLDPVYFGHNEDAAYKARLGLLSKEQLGAMEPFVQRKLEEAKERILVEWEEDESRAYLAKVML